MIRAFLIFSGFMAITIALIAIQPTARLRGPDPVAQEVTRAEPPADPVVDTAPYDPADEEPLSFGLMDTAVLTSAPAPEAAPAPSLLPETVQPRVVVEAPVPQPLPEGSAGLEAMIVRALGQGQSEAYIDAYLNDAARRGTVEVPAELVTPDGRVDTDTLLRVLSSRGARETAARTAEVYVVRPGDSLASIAYRFYGQTRFHEEIYRANRAEIDAAGQLMVGQRLVMPAP